MTWTQLSRGGWGLIPETPLTWNVPQARNNHAPELGNQRQVIKIIMVLVKMIIVRAPDKATSSRFPPFKYLWNTISPRGQSRVKRFKDDLQIKRWNISILTWQGNEDEDGGGRARERGKEKKR